MHNLCLFICQGANDRIVSRKIFYSKDLWLDRNFRRDNFNLLSDFYILMFPSFS